MNRTVSALCSLSALCLTLSGLSPASSASAQVNRGPYLQQGSDDAMTVVWRTASSAPSVVCYGAAVGSLSSRATAGAGTQHEVRITGLAPDTQYFYALSDDACPPAAAGDASQYFRTAPTPGTARPFRFWVVGDSGTGGSRQQQVTDAMLAYVGAARPDIYVHVGDMAYSDGTTSEFDSRFFAMYDSILRNTVCWPAMGNHEGHTSDSASQSGPYYDAYVLPIDGAAGGIPSGTEAYYSYDWANVHFVVMDSHQTSRAVGGAMLTWLDMDLDSTDQDWLIAYWHHPPYTKGSHDSDTEGALVDMRENALPILEAAGVDLVLGGHSHIYERSYLISGAYDTPTTAAGYILDPGDGRPAGDGAYVKAGDGTIYIVAGHGGTGVSGAGDHPVMFFSELDNGSNIVDVTADTLTITNIRRDGVESDQVVLVKGTGLFLLTPRGGENVLAGSDLSITWGSSGPVGDVRIEYSLDGGGSWAPVADRTANDGLETWTTPLFRTTQARVRITDLDDSTNTSESGDFELSGRAERVAIPMGDVWEYLDDGAAPGASWRTETGGWASGPAELGYGDGDEATTIYDTDPNVPTVFFRRGVTIDETVVAARLRVLYDDGVVVWVNGVEVASFNVADGDDYAAYASTGSADNEVQMVEIPITAGAPFVTGANVISAVVKQSGSGSSDLSFDLSLILDIEVDLPAPPLPDGGPGSIDGGSPDDGGIPADGVAPGVDSGPAVGDDGGCGCAAVGAPRAASLRAVAWFGALLVIGIAVRRRGRRRS
ncbi:MAG: hypothetical protein DRJ42_02630 [Deltaproteobacteria bacterium]|nr:MAG: hypothetical protein DRJ42_02630 [Deltaproteobacteria bacterium]